ncbi:MAG: hypothetical protein IMW89_17630 [Ktedonobacteraceae bacterium]|nr:hypothetical protein [Ktedonobacteraceae bacterium]
MYSLLNDNLAQQHQQNLLREAEVERRASLARQQNTGNASLPHRLPSSTETHEELLFLKGAYERRGILSDRPVVLQNITISEPDWAAIRQEVLATFAALRCAEQGEEDRLIDAFIDRLRYRLPPARMLLFAQPFPVHLWLLLLLAITSFLLLLPFLR